MFDLITAQQLFKYSEFANDKIIEAAANLNDAELDEAFSMGRGNLRKTLLHILAGEFVWLRRCRGEVETPWYDESQLVAVDEIKQRLHQVNQDRRQFLSSLSAESLLEYLDYRDSLGELFNAQLGHMILQTLVHSTHHRAQAVNMLRRLTDQVVELDYMMWIREPAQVH